VGVIDRDPSQYGCGAIHRALRISLPQAEKGAMNCASSAIRTQTEPEQGPDKSRPYVEREELPVFASEAGSRALAPWGWRPETGGARSWMHF